MDAVTPLAPGPKAARKTARKAGSMTPDARLAKIWKPLVFATALLPLGWVAWKLFFGTGAISGLGANPIEYLNRYLGDWALRFLLLTLVITPAVKITGNNAFVRFRRMIGLFAFFYAALHVSSYVVLDQFFDWAAIWKDIVKRTYITLGMISLVILTVLAATSPKAALKKIGFKKWRALHRLVYVAGVLAVVHYYMMIKADVREPLIYGAILAMLLGYRVWVRSGKRLSA